MNEFEPPKDWDDEEETPDEETISDRYYDFSEVLNEDIPEKERGELLDKASDELLGWLKFMVQRFGLRDSVDLLCTVLEYQKDLMRDFAGEKLAAQFEADATGEPSAKTMKAVISTFFTKKLLENVTDGGTKRFTFPKGTQVKKMITIGVCIKEPIDTYFCQVVPNHGSAEKADAIEEALTAFFQNFIED